jgi:N-dimethylarginine dimethylaminohydrolase
MTNSKLPRINSHNSWSKLEEVWLGDVYPAAWYDHLDTSVRDVFYQLTEITKQDLAAIQQILEQLGVQVQRPEYKKIEDYLDDNDQLIKPQITPRDQFVVIGNELLGYKECFEPWRETINRYTADPQSTVTAHDDKHVNGANVVRAGKDIIVDRDCFEWEYDGRWPEYRVKVVANGGHMDGCFAILRPGLIIANHYWDEYETTFPGWDIIMLDNPTYQAAPSQGHAQTYPVYNGKFWNTGTITNRTFNEHIVRHALDWVGCYTETFFELNCLVIDESNVVMLAENIQIEKELKQRGISVHWVPFRARSFWDGAMHCLTVDIRRQSCITDHF